MKMFPCKAFCILLSLIQLHYGSARHSVVKRKAADGQLYVFSRREGCVSVTSRQPCTLSWRLNPYFAKLYEQKTEAVKRVVKLYDDLYGEKCSGAVENALCTQQIPRCFDDGSQDYGDAKTICKKTYDSCPSTISAALKQQGFCENMKAGKFPKRECVALSRPIEGVCPQPKYKMPSDFLADYEKLSIQQKKSFDQIRTATYGGRKYGERIFSDGCLLKLEDISCSPLYCSDDGKYLLIAHDQEDCNSIISTCFDEPLKRLSITPELSNLMDNLRSTLKSTCKIYPRSSSAQVQPEPQSVEQPSVEPPSVEPSTVKPPNAKTLSSATSSLLNSFLLSLSIFTSINYLF